MRGLPSSLLCHFQILRIVKEKHLSLERGLLLLEMFISFKRSLEGPFGGLMRDVELQLSPILLAGFEGEYDF